LRLDQLDETFNSAMESHHNIRSNVEVTKEIVLQELGNVKREVEMYAIQTTGCQKGLQELKAKVDAESSQRHEQFKVHANFVSNESLEWQQQFKACARSASEILNTKILDFQELKTITKAVGVQEPPNFRNVITSSFSRVKCPSR